MEQRFALLEKQIEHQTVVLDKRLDEMRQQISEVRTEITSLREDTNDRFASVSEELRQLNQNHTNHLEYHMRTGDDANT